MLQEAIDRCNVRSAIFRASNLHKKYWKYDVFSWDEKISDSDKNATDWSIFDPKYDLIES